MPWRFSSPLTSGAGSSCVARGAASRAYKALLPDDRAAPYFKQVATLHVLAEVVRGKLGPVDISAIYAKIEALLDEKIEGVAITAPIVEGDAVGDRVDLSDIDFDKLAGLFQQKPKTANEQLRARPRRMRGDMAEENPTRNDLVDRLEALVASTTPAPSTRPSSSRPSSVSSKKWRWSSAAPLVRGLPSGSWPCSTF